MAEKLRDMAEEETAELEEADQKAAELDAEEAKRQAEAIKEAAASLEWMITEDGDRLTVLTIKKRKIPLRLVLSDVKSFEQEIGKVSDAEDLLKDDFMSAEHVGRVIHAIRILGNSGLRAMGKEPDLTDEWIGDRLRINDINIPMILQLLVTIWGGMGMETETEEGKADDGKEHDVVLEDLRKKKAGD